jgi:Lon protease-like protein
MYRLPLFPLSTVLFPRMVLPLHIFEERYKAMIKYCDENDRPFGIVLIREGEEVGAPAEPFSVGTEAHILRITDLEDQRKLIVVQGRERFTIEELSFQEPYLVGEVEKLPLETGGLDSRLLGHVEIAFYRYLRMLKQAQGLSVSISNLPEDPEGVAWMVAWGLQMDQKIKQELLGVANLQELLLREQALLEEENRMLYLLGQEDVRRRQPPENQGYISSN